MSLRQWYTGTRIPSSIENCQGYVLRSAGLITSLVDESVNVTVTTAHLGGTPAQVELNTAGTEAIIRVDSQLFKDDSEEYDFTEIDSETFITMVLGVIVHELSHVINSEKDLRVAIESVPGFAFNGLSIAVMNIVEDVYIENYIREYYPSIAWMINGALDVLLPISEYDISANFFKGPVEKLDDLDVVLPAMIAWKNLNAFPPLGSSEFMVRIHSLMMEALNSELESRQRAKIAKEIYEILVENLEMPDDDDDSKSKGNPEDSEDGEGSESEGDESGDEGEDGGSDGDEGDGDSEAESGDKSGTGSGEGEEESTLEGVLKRIIDLDTDPQVYGDGAHIDLSEIPVEFKQGKATTITISDEAATVWYTPESSVNLTQPSEIWLSVEKLGRIIAAGTPRARLMSNRGRRIGDISRIATDGRIFQKRVGEYGKKGRDEIDNVPRDITILLDCSGSMSYYIQEAAKMAVGAAIGFEAAGHSVTVLGHTGDISRFNRWSDVGKAAVIMYNLKLRDESTAVLASRVTTISTASGYLGNNFDGFAVIEACNTMKGKGRKQLIVISDGAPSGSGYSSTMAISHSKKAADDARRKGIEVVSISINEDALEANNKIYGGGNNFHVNSISDINVVIKKLM